MHHIKFLVHVNGVMLMDGHFICNWKSAT